MCGSGIKAHQHAAKRPMTAAHPRLEMMEGAAVPEEGALAVGGTRAAL